MVWTDATSGLLGSIIGAAAAIGAQIITQNATGKRDKTERARREARVSALFAAYTEAVASVAAIGAAGYLWQTDQMIRSLAPLIALMNESDMLTALEPKQIRALSEARVSVELCMQTAVETRARYDVDSKKATSGSQIADLDDRLRRRLGGTYRLGFEALNASLISLGVTPVAPFNDGSEDLTSRQSLAADS